MSNAYDEAYYRERNYSDYLGRGPRYERMIAEIMDLLGKISLVEKSDQILDYGCGPGLVCRALDLLGYVGAIGYDTSTWAVSYGLRKFGIGRLTTARETVEGKRWQLGFALDVLEHMTDEELKEMLAAITPLFWLVRIPVAAEDGGRFILDVSNQDPHHINPKTKESWSRLFHSWGYAEFARLRLFSIYDSEGVYCALFRREFLPDRGA